MAATVQPPRFGCQVAREGARDVVVLQGELDLATAEILQRDLDRLLEAGSTALVLDLEELTFVDSSGLRCVWTLAQRASRERIDLEIRPAPAQAMRIFEVTGTLEKLPFRSRS